MKKQTNLELVEKYGFSKEPFMLLSKMMGTNLQAKVLSTFLINSRSNTEAKWSQVSKDVITSITQEAVVFAGYEWVSFKVPGGSYKPDWFYVLQNGAIVCVEVKASKHQKGYADSRSKLRAAASLNPWITFYQATAGKNKTWTIEKIDPDQSFITTLLNINGG